MKQFEMNGKIISNDCYINYKLIRDVSELETFLLLEPKELLANVSVPFSKFINDLNEYESGNKHNTSANKLKRLGVQLTFLIDENRNYEDSCLVFKSITKHFNNLPSFAYTYTQGNGYYMCIFFAERYYYPNGTHQRYSKNIYKDKITGKLTTADNPNAVLSHKKNEINSNKTVYFSDKSSVFKFWNREGFYNWLKTTKEWFISLLERLFSIVVDNYITLPKYVLKGLKMANLRNAKKWNDYIKKLEESFNNSIYAFSQLGLLGDPTLVSKIQNDIVNLYNKYKNILHLRKFKDKKHSNFKFEISFNSHYSVDDTADVLVGYCFNDQANLINKYI